MTTGLGGGAALTLLELRLLSLSPVVDLFVVAESRSALLRAG